MAFEDLFGEKKVISPEAEIVDNPNLAGDDGGFDFAALLEDPNFIRGLGEAGASISSGEPIGKSVGDFASNLTRRRAIQKGARESRGRERSFQERLLSMLSEGNLLSAKDQNDAFDTLSIDGDGNVNLGMKNTPQKPGFQRQQSLESVRRPSARGDDLPNFSDQPGEGDFDFAGLDAEDIGMLLSAEQQFGQLSRNEMKILLNEKARKSEAVTQSKIRAEKLKQLGLDRTAKVKAKALEVTEKKDTAKLLAESKTALEERKSALKTNADKLTPEELKVEALELRKLTKEVENLEAGIGKPASVADQIAQKKLKIAERGEKRGIAEDEIATQEFILNPDTPRVTAEFQAKKENAKVDGEQVFFNAVDAPWFGSNTDIMDVWQIPEDLIFNGQKVTPPMLVELAEQRGVTLQELITALEGQ